MAVYTVSFLDRNVRRSNIVVASSKSAVKDYYESEKRAEVVDIHRATKEETEDAWRKCKAFERIPKSPT